MCINQPIVSINIYFIKNDSQKEFSLNSTKAKFAEDYCLAQMIFDEVKKNLWQIVDNKKTKARDKIKVLKQLAGITVKTLEFIPILEVILRVNKLNEDLKKR